MRKVWGYLKKHWLISLPVALLILGGSFAGTLQYTTTPGFCSSCHIMEPYYASWKASSHNNVACVDCHYAPGEKYKLSSKLKALNQVVAFWTGSYDTEFYVDIADSSCTTCHSTERLARTIEWDNGKRFNHEAHYGLQVRGMELRCTSCHTHLIEKDHMAIDKATCFLCHFKDQITPGRPMPQSFCLECHSVPQDDIELEGQVYNHAAYVEQGVDCQRCHIEAISGQGLANVRSCQKCHDSQAILDQIGDVTEIHRIHVTSHKVECFTCHSEIRHGVRIHSQQVSFSCEQCHSEPHLGPRELYAGTGGRGVEDMPSSMYTAQVDCIGCHLDSHTDPIGHVMKGTVMRPSVKGCVDCHGEIGADFYEIWNEMLADAIASATVKVGLAASRVDLARTDAPGYSEARSLIEDARYNVDFVRIGRGIHNVNYSLALLSKAEEFAEQALAALEAGQ